MYVKNVKSRPLIYGLTGGIASGKTTASNFFKKKNIIVFDSDLYVSNLWKNDNELKDVIKKRYNINMNLKDGKRQLANLIFENEVIRKEINNLIHPLVFDAIDKLIENNINEKFIIVDMPLLIETNYYKKCDFVILMYVDENIQVERLMLRNKINQKEALIKINAQIALKDKIKFADYIIDNNKSINNTYKQLNKLLEVMNNE